MAKVFVNAGHGGSDPGAVANGFKEKDLNLAIAKACQAELERHGVDVFMCRTGDTFQSLQADIDDCNNFNPDLALDIHNNAGGGDGAEVFYSVVGGTGKVLAQNILDEIVAIGQNSRGIKTKINSQGRDWFGIIRETYAPCVLVECAFVDTKADLAIVDTPAEQKAMGVAIAKGVLKTLGIAWKAPEAPKPAKLYRVQVGAYAVRENAEAMLAKLKKAGFTDAYIRE
jgi:N-acetylmuramoyl-L-alanine amidase